MKGKNKIKGRLRHRILFAILKAIIWPVLKINYGYKYDSLKDIKEPYLLVVNHNLVLDPAFVGVAAGRQLYFVASEHLSRKGFVTKLLMWVFNPILHQKGKAGVNTVATMLRTLRAGSSVCIFPEGNRSFNGQAFPIAPSIGKLARKSGAGLVTFCIEGGYLSDPRWGFTRRKGKLYGHKVHYLTAAELKTMTDDEVNKLIVDDISEDAYARQREYLRTEGHMMKFIGKKPAYGLESAVGMCPACRAFGKMHTSETELICECGYRARYDEYGCVSEENGKSLTVAELDNLQIEEIRSKVELNTAEMLFDDEVLVYKVGEAKGDEEPVSGTLKAFADHVEFNGRTLTIDDFEGYAIHSRNTMIAFLRDEDTHYEVKGKNPLYCAYKYLHLYRAMGGEG